MTAFGSYSLYYNLLYSDKDYAAETRFMLEALDGAGCRPRSLLDLGCGTGRHALALAAGGIEVTGVDISETMLTMGRESLRERPDAKVALLRGDARTVRLGRAFDAVSSLFHVMSYQTGEEDALAVLETARLHLEPGGCFFFDFWHGPGVLRDPPTNRLKVMEDASIRVERKAVPFMRTEDNIVEVRYTVDLLDRRGGRERIEENHVMRYWFVPELRRLARRSGFTCADCGAWMERSPPGPESWYAWMLLRLERFDIENP
ncbi:MAG: class I SAM-dependent methyltransferase [Desulfovibrio sp.]|jgi:SAM-dependent methyltransferase|nr:class I SAM-dependent methyltransferase [Desulfovibrio sp.]